MLTRIRPTCTLLTSYDIDENAGDRDFPRGFDRGLTSAVLAADLLPQ